MSIERTSYILIPFGSEFLALSQEAFKECLERGRKMAGTVTPMLDTQPIEKLIDADIASKVTGIPASWFLEAARQERIPHIKMGKYVRFRMSNVIEALEVRPRHEVRNSY